MSASPPPRSNVPTISAESAPSRRSAGREDRRSRRRSSRRRSRLRRRRRPGRRRARERAGSPAVLHRPSGAAGLSCVEAGSGCEPDGGRQRCAAHERTSDEAVSTCWGGSRRRTCTASWREPEWRPRVPSSPTTARRESSSRAGTRPLCLRTRPGRDARWSQRQSPSATASSPSCASISCWIGSPLPSPAASRARLHARVLGAEAWRAAGRRPALGGVFGRRSLHARAPPEGKPRSVPVVSRPSSYGSIPLRLGRPWASAGA